MPADIELIYQRGSHYDFLCGTAVPPFWLDHARRYGGPILELGCGTGRLAIPLAQAGYAVTGLDRSPSMLTEARKKAARQGVKVHWQEGDIRAFTLDPVFAWAFLANNTLCHLLTRMDFEACLACVRRALKPEGYFIVEVFVPNLALLLQPSDARHIFAEYDDPEGRGHIVVWETSLYDPSTQIKHNRISYQFPDQANDEVGDLPMRMYFPQELDALFHYNGFIIEHKYGGLDGRPFDAAASTQVFVLRMA